MVLLSDRRAYFCPDTNENAGTPDVVGAVGGVLVSILRGLPISKLAGLTIF
jgi:hypothetical protein